MNNFKLGLQYIIIFKVIFVLGMIEFNFLIGYDVIYDD